eukprot:gene4943-5741_t
MSGWDSGGVFVSGGGGMSGSRSLNDTNNANGSSIQEKFLHFVRDWKNQDNAFIYRDQLKQHYDLEHYYIVINIDHLTQFDPELSNQLVFKPNEVIPLFELAAREAVKKMKFNLNDHEIHDIQVLFRNTQDPSPIRSLKANHIARMVKIPGIVISASRTQLKPVNITVMCRGCGDTQRLTVTPGITNNPLPMTCNKRNEGGQQQCPNNPYAILPDQSVFVNQQILKLQESPESIPTGEMPRHIQLSLDRFLCERITPGTRVTVLGVFGIYQGAGGGRGKRDVSGSATIRTPYMRVLGITADSENGGRDSMFFTPHEEDEFRKFSKRTDIHKIISDSIAPSIYGHTDIKKAIACQLFGGSAKRLPDKMKLRGDINLLLLGDPGTAKSQLLKFVEKVAPISVYTSGKGSSAAGLTASVIREPSTGEFYLEGGAMVVADGGVVCIDEFDKMDVNDRVAIHEAMEQQTISIAKAGITTILNSRTSVLAAANPVYGRYDDMKSAGDNIDFQTTILSRFDLIFIVRDPRIEKRDKDIAIHEVSWYTKDPNDAVEALKNHYVSVRATVRQQEVEGQTQAIPITVRQLEAIIRISESLAKMSLATTATSQHVTEAIRLFTISTFDAITTDNAVGDQMTPQMLMEVQNAETLLKRRVPIGSKVSIKKVADDLSSQSISTFAVRKAIDILVKREDAAAGNNLPVTKLLVEQRDPVRLLANTCGGSIDEVIKLADLVILEYLASTGYIDGRTLLASALEYGKLETTRYIHDNFIYTYVPMADKSPQTLLVPLLDLKDLDLIGYILQHPSQQVIFDVYEFKRYLSLLLRRQPTMADISVIEYVAETWLHRPIDRATLAIDLPSTLPEASLALALAIMATIALNFAKEIDLLDLAHFIPLAQDPTLLRLLFSRRGLVSQFKRASQNGLLYLVSRHGTLDQVRIMHALGCPITNDTINYAGSSVILRFLLDNRWSTCRFDPVAFETARSRGDLEAVRMLFQEQDLQANIQSTSYYCGSSGTPEIARYLLSLGHQQIIAEMGRNMHHYSAMLDHYNEFSPMMTPNIEQLLITALYYEYPDVVGHILSTNPGLVSKYNILDRSLCGGNRHMVDMVLRGLPNETFKTLDIWLDVGSTGNIEMFDLLKSHTNQTVLAKHLEVGIIGAASQCHFKLLNHILNGLECGQGRDYLTKWFGKLYSAQPAVLSYLLAIEPPLLASDMLKRILERFIVNGDSVLTDILYTHLTVNLEQTITIDPMVIERATYCHPSIISYLEQRGIISPDTSPMLDMFNEE